MSNTKKIFKFLLVTFLTTFALSSLSLISKLSSNDGSDVNSSINSDSSSSEDENKINYFKYSNKSSYDSSTESLMFFIPSNGKFINYNLVHTIKESTNVDVWRLSTACAYSKNFGLIDELTTTGAEWDMALKLKDRPDFIGGSAHGDEVYTDFEVYVDNKKIDFSEYTDLTSFTEIKIVENSIGYDPNDSITQALKHNKEFIINENGVQLNQKVEWLNDYDLDYSYLAMLPPLKKSSFGDIITDSYFINNDLSTFETIPSSISETIDNITSASVYGTTSKYLFTMSIGEYPKLTSSDSKFLLADNGGANYNKMYFVCADGGSVTSGTIWNSTTYYQIQANVELDI